METIKTFPIKGGGVQCVKKIILVQKHCIKPFSVFLAVQDSSIVDLVTHSVNDTSFDSSVFRAVQSCCRPF